jgi:hypothetical protein
MTQYKVTYNWTWSWGEVERKEWTLYTESALDNYLITLRRNNDKVSDLTIEPVKVK